MFKFCLCYSYRSEYLESGASRQTDGGALYVVQSLCTIEEEDTMKWWS